MWLSGINRLKETFTDLVIGQLSIMEVRRGKQWRHGVHVLCSPDCEPVLEPFESYLDGVCIVCDLMKSK